MGEVTVITAALPHRTSLLADAIRSVHAQTVPVREHLISVAPRRRVADVRNDLIDAADSEWVAFLDDDDLLDPHHVETLLRQADNADVVIPYCRFDGPPLPDGYCNRPFDLAALRSHGIFPITVLARRELVLAAGGFAAEGWDDWVLWNRMADDGCRFVTVPTVTWTYRTSTPSRRTHALLGAS